MPKASRIPREVIEFFNAPGGHSLIVKGQAGTGKTTFALQLTEELGEVASSHYLSSRVSDESLYNQFSWLKDRLKPAILQAPPKPAHPTTKVTRVALDQLEGKIQAGEETTEEEAAKSVAGAEVKDGFLEMAIGFDLPEVEAAYDFVDARIPKRSLVLIDSVDALAEHYGIAQSKLINVLQRDLVEGNRQNVLYVLEGSGETRLDYLGDGVVNLASTEHEGRRLRVMTIEKLRGQQVRQHKYLYTLDGGRLEAFRIADDHEENPPKPWKPVPDPSKASVSTGLRSLDGILGGFAKGRVVAFEISTQVPADYVDWLRTAIMCNFVAQGRGVAHVPPRKGSAEYARELVSPHLPPNSFETHIQVFESVTLGGGDVSRNALHMEGNNVDTDLKWSNVEYHLPKSTRPYLALMAFDTLESVYGDKVLEQMSGVLGAVRRSKDVFVGFATPQSASATKLSNLASAVLHLESVNGSVVLYGEKPYTELFNLSWDWSGGVPDAVLRPIV
ncbi:MAG TPA: gas vesicle protein GvpD P-loop domain-containing protein [Thermoplasmata archaeon]|nr:gas vesicle protein GvpD P-loop domain-containing protein [Thermoplasmata archaeon]